MSRQMSTAMMSAPSLAIAIACARPCPRAAPVMNATLPSSLPAIRASFGYAEADAKCTFSWACRGILRLLAGSADRRECDVQFAEATHDERRFVGVTAFVGWAVMFLGHRDV